MSSNQDIQQNDSASRKFNMVYVVSVILTLIVTAWGIVSNSTLKVAADWLFVTITVNFGWLYLLTVAFFVFFCFYLAFGKYGHIVLGPDDCKPEFSTVSWFAMLFGAGMGIGLIFYGGAEPLMHFTAPPEGMGIEAGTSEAALFAMKTSFLHWGLHPWASFAVTGLGLAYFQFRKNKPGLISSLFIPLLGEKRTQGPIGNIIDILATIATVFGVCTSLGLGTMQINGGLSYIFGIPENNMTWLIIVVCITFLYLGTAVSGVDKGIQLIGNINLWLAFILLIGCFILGPTLFILNILTAGVGDYVNNIIYDGLSLNVFGSNEWVQGWRVFYWAWWISWCPFVGTFIARISKGRTVREFVCGVMIIPTLLSLLWFAVFGSMGLNLQSTIGTEGIAKIASSLNTALFEVFTHYPLSSILSLIAVFLVCTFFVTSANSATYVLGMLSDDGKMFPAKHKLFVWGLLVAALAYILMITGGQGSLKTLQTASIGSALPFVFIMIASCASLLMAFNEEIRPEK